MVVDVPAACGIEFGVQGGVEHQVDGNGVGGLRLEVLHIDLPRDGLVAVDDGRGAFADLYGFHPWSGDILQAEGLRQSADVGCVLCEQLHIGAAESEQTYLFGSCGGIGVRHIHRGTGLETFREVAARGFGEFLPREGLHVQGRDARPQNCHLPLGDADFVQDEVADENDGEGAVVAHVGGVVVVAEVTADKQARAVYGVDGEDARRVGCHACGGACPIDIRPHKGLTAIV